tara:strand:- start:1445 stop:2077 length:633 start_codon:yes stop_codon:yes gene_type:complete
MPEFTSSDEARGLYYLKTIINQSKRRKLELTVNQYAMLDVIDHFLVKHGNMTKGELREMVDMYGIENAVQEFKYLKENGFLFMMKENTVSFVVLSPKFNGSLVPSDYEEKFELLWNDYGRVGNKVNSKKMFLLFLKSGGSWEVLWTDCWPMYKKHLTLSGASQLHLSTYLNPENERYNDEWKSNAHYQDKERGFTAPKITVNKNPKKSRS